MDFETAGYEKLIEYGEKSREASKQVLFAIWKHKLNLDTEKRQIPENLVVALLILAQSPYLDANDRALTWSWFDRTLRQHVDVCDQGRDPRGRAA